MRAVSSHTKTLSILAQEMQIQAQGGIPTQLSERLKQPGIVAHAFNPSTRWQKQEDFWVQGQPGLLSEFQDSQGYTEKPCLEKPKKKKAPIHIKQNVKKKKAMSLRDQEGFT